MQNGEPTSGWAEDHGEDRYYFSENYNDADRLADARTASAIIFGNGRHRPNRHPDRGRQTVLLCLRRLHADRVSRRWAARSTTSAQTASMLTGWQTIGSQKYYFLANGTYGDGNESPSTERSITFNADGTQKKIKICLDAGHYGKYNRSPVNGSIL